jgi:hemoglobin-like flavoprotein
MGFADRFYNLLLGANVKIRALFNDTNFSEQKKALIDGIYVLIDYSEGGPLGKMSINRLSEKHNRSQMNVPADLYEIWVDCFIQALSEKDPEFSQSLEKEWREALKPGIDQMISEY